MLHTGLGVAAVAAATHLVVWLRRYVRGQHGRRRAVMRFAWLVLALQLAAFVVGNLMYPTYQRRGPRRVPRERAGGGRGRPTRAPARSPTSCAATRRRPPSRSPRIWCVAREQAARWFDVKEHAIALGLFASAALVLVLACWDVRRDGTAIAPIATGLAVFVAATLWLGAIIGVLTAAWRAI